MRKSLSILSFCSLIFLFAGCFTRNSLRFYSPDKGAYISALPQNYGYPYYGYGGMSFPTISGTDSLIYPTINQGPPSVEIRIDKKGYRSKICYVYPPYNKHNILPSLSPYPMHKDGQRQMYIERVSVNIDSNKMVKNYYNSMNDFNNGKANVTVPNNDKIVHKNISTDNLNNILLELNYIDTTGEKKLNFLDYNWLKVYVNLTNVTVNSVKSQSCLDVTCSWKLVECMTGKTLYNQALTSRSNWGGSGDTLILDAIRQGLCDFLSDPKLAPFLEDGKAAYQNVVNGWDSIPVQHANGYATNIQQATKAVVTVKLQHGHGSGCVVSSDGYIITNSHVAGDTNTFAIIFQNGDTHYARLIRSNPLYDLALIKVDTLPASVKPLQILNDDTWSIGNDVYAIGTPEDLELGQTLTRGIISAVRVVQDKKYIQTDVSINPGNSGGALTNTDGVLIGIVKAKFVKKGSSGLGFAIPSDNIQVALKLQYR